MFNLDKSIADSVMSRPVSMCEADIEANIKAKQNKTERYARSRTSTLPDELEEHSKGVARAWRWRVDNAGIWHTCRSN